MNIVFLLIPLALGLGIVFLVGFIWSTFSGQYDDLDKSSQAVFFED